MLYSEHLSEKCDYIFYFARKKFTDHLVDVFIAYILMKNETNHTMIFLRKTCLSNLKNIEKKEVLWRCLTDR